MSLKIRNCQLSDFTKVFKLLEQLWFDSILEYDSLRGVFENILKTDTQKLVVGIVENKIIGFCSLTIKHNLWQAGNLGHIDELVIDKEFRGKGYGKKMIENITNLAQELKCKRIELDSAFNRTEAHEFYKTLEYEKRAYLFSKKID